MAGFSWLGSPVARACVCLNWSEGRVPVVVVPLELQSVDILRLSELHWASVGVA